MRFMPTNFSRPKARAESTSEGAPSTSVSVASKSESAFEDLMKAAKTDAAWQRRGGRGGGRGFGGTGANRALTTFGGGAGEGGGGGLTGRRVWGGRGANGGAAGGTKRLVKAGDKVKGEGGGRSKVKSEDGGLDGGAEEDEEAGGGWRPQSSEESDGEPEEDPISYDQDYPVVLPHRCETAGRLTASQADGYSACAAARSLQPGGAWPGRTPAEHIGLGGGGGVGREAGRADRVHLRPCLRGTSPGAAAAFEPLTGGSSRRCAGAASAAAPASLAACRAGALCRCSAGPPAKARRRPTVCVQAEG